MRVLIIPTGFSEYSLHLANATSQFGSIWLPLPIRIKADFRQFINSQVNVVWYDDNDQLSLKRLEFIRTILMLIDSIKPDIIHIQQGNIWLCPLVPTMRKYTVVTTVHDVFRHPGEENHVSDLSDLLISRITKHFITHGQFLKDSLIQRRKIEKEFVSVIPHGGLTIARDLGGIDPKENGQNLLFFGRMKKYKGLDTLIDGMSLVVQKVPEAKLIIAGKGEELDKNLPSLRKLPWVEIQNSYLSNNQINLIFNRSSVVVLPYHEASQSGVISLAYTFGKPVIATKTGALPEVVEDGVTGLLVPIKDPKSLAQAIIYLLRENQKRISMGNAAYKKSQTDLSWTKIAKMTINAYQRALDYLD